MLFNIFVGAIVLTSLTMIISGILYLLDLASEHLNIKTAINNIIWTAVILGCCYFIGDFVDNLIKAS